MANFVYVDNSNLWIEGRHLSVVQLGWLRHVNEAQDRRVADTRRARTRPMTTIRSETARTLMEPGP